MSETTEPAPEDAWKVDHSQFPAGGSTADKFRFLLNYAVLAPSERNSQPWLFRVCDDCIELYADRNRELPVVDPEDRELTMSCGATLFYLRIAMRHFGYEGEVEEFPDPEDPDLLARVGLGGTREPSHLEEAVFEAIPKRHTNRFPFSNDPVPEELLYKLEAAARQEDAWLHVVVATGEHYSVADLIAEADQQQWSDRQFRAETTEWIHLDSDPGSDGIPGYAFPLDEVDPAIGPLLMQAFDMSGRVSSRDYKLAIGAPLLAILGTNGDEPSDWLHAGQALANVLLRATAEGVSAGFFNQPIEIPEMRKMLRETTGVDGYPQLMLRLGYGHETRPTPRRKPDDVAIK